MRTDCVNAALAKYHPGLRLDLDPERGVYVLSDRFHSVYNWPLRNAFARASRGLRAIFKRSHTNRETVWEFAFLPSRDNLLSFLGKTCVINDPNRLDEILEEVDETHEEMKRKSDAEDAEARRQAASDAWNQTYRVISGAGHTIGNRELSKAQKQRWADKIAEDEAQQQMADRGLLDDE